MSRSPAVPNLQTLLISYYTKTLNPKSPAPNKVAARFAPFFLPPFSFIIQVTCTILISCRNVLPDICMARLRLVPTFAPSRMELKSFLKLFFFLSRNFGVSIWVIGTYCEEFGCSFFVCIGKFGEYFKMFVSRVLSCELPK